MGNWYRRLSKSKYGAKKAEYGGKTYHSKGEAGYAGYLDLQVKAGEIKSWTRQNRISLDVNGFHICNIIPDFLLTYPDGSQEIVEYKGMATQEWLFKAKLLKATYLHEHPEIGFRVVYHSGKEEIWQDGMVPRRKTSYESRRI